MSVKNQVLEILKSKDWVDVRDFEKVFPPGTEGHMSWSQRKRELHKDYTIIKRKKFGCSHTYEYHLVIPAQFVYNGNQAGFAFAREV